MESRWKNKIAVILAAGYSSRMNGFKATLDILGKNPVERLIEETEAAGIERIILVTGYKRELLEPFVKGKVEEVYNKDYEKGMNSSVKAAINKLLSEREAPLIETLDAVKSKGIDGVKTEIRNATKPEANCGTKGASCEDNLIELNLTLNNLGVFLLPVDIPLITRDVIHQLLKAVNEEEEAQETQSFWVPTYKGKKGHPLYIPQRFFREIVDCKGSNGLKDVTVTNFLNMKYLEVGDERILIDMDTREDYENLLLAFEKFLSAKRESLDTKESIKEGGIKNERAKWGTDKAEKIANLSKGKRFILVRHGTIMQHKDKIFLGQTDVPLSEKGVNEIKESTVELNKLNIETRIIYTSPLRRAKDSAEIISEAASNTIINNGKLEVLSKNGLKEMSLGDWDGKLIREIRENYPEEYKLRGENLLRYKPRGKSENFYDLRYRVEKALIEILENDGNKDILIVSHKGVIKVIEALLLGEDMGNKVLQTKESIECGQFKVICN